MQFNIAIETIYRLARLQINHGKKAVTEDMNMMSWSVDKKNQARKQIEKAKISKEFLADTRALANAEEEEE